MHITDEILESLLQSVSLSNSAFVWLDGSRVLIDSVTKITAQFSLSPALAHTAQAHRSHRRVLSRKTAKVNIKRKGGILGVRMLEVKSNAICVTILK